MAGRCHPHQPWERLAERELPRPGARAGDRVAVDRAVAPGRVVRAGEAAVERDAVDHAERVLDHVHRDFPGTAGQQHVRIGNAKPEASGRECGADPLLRAQRGSVGYSPDRRAELRTPLDQCPLAEHVEGALGAERTREPVGTVADHARPDRLDVHVAQRPVGAAVPALLDHVGRAPGHGYGAAPDAQPPPRRVGVLQRPDIRIDAAVGANRRLRARELLHLERVLIGVVPVGPGRPLAAHHEVAEDVRSADP